MLELKLLGNPEVRLEGVVLSLPPKRLALLAYLALEGGPQCQPLRRSVLCSVLWSEQDAESARRNLRQELHRLKATPLSACLQLTPETVGLTVADCDALRFEAADPAPEHPDVLSDLLALYSGPLLHELELPQEGAFDEWLQERRERLHGRWLELRRQWAAHLETAGDLWGAVEALEPLREMGDESAAVRTMHLQARLGQREVALHTFARLEQGLHDLGLTPAPETLALRERLRGLPSLQPAPRRASLHHPPLIGRDALIAELEEHLLKQGGLLLLEGEPGSGKTALASALAQRWGPGLRLQGREETQATPFLPVSEALRGVLPQLSDLPPAWRREVARLLPELESGNEHGSTALSEQGEGRARFLEGLSVALRHALGGGLLWLDDLQWFDPSSLEVLGLALRPENWRAIATARPLERRQNAPLEQLLSALERRRAVSFRELPPLTETDLLRLIRVLSSSVSGGVRFARRLHAATHGNPLFALETLKTLLDSGELREQDGVWHTEFDAATQDYHELPLPVSVRSAVLSRLGQLSEGTQQLLASAALLGDAFELPELEGSTPLSEWAQLDALEQALGAGFLRVDPASSQAAPRYQFSHHLVQRALTSNLSAERRRWLHRQLAATLARLEARPARLAVHLEGAGQRQQAAQMRLRAAQEAADVYAHLETLEHLDAALRLELDAPTTFEVQLQRAGVYSMLDDKPAWEAALEAARACAQQPGDLLRLELRFCELEFHLGRYPAVLERVNALWEQPDLTPEQRGWAGLWAGNANSRTARLTEAVDWYRRALDGVPEHELILRGRLLNAWAYALYVLGELDDGKEKVQEAMECFVAANYRKGQAMAHNTAGALAEKADDDEEAVSHYQQSYDCSQEIGDLQNQRLALSNLGGTYLKALQLEKALTAINSGLELIEILPDPYSECLFYEDLAEIYKLRNQYNRSLSTLDKGLQIADLYELNDWSAQGRVNKVRLLIILERNDDEVNAVICETRAILSLVPDKLKNEIEQELKTLLLTRPDVSTLESSEAAQ
ncbi:transcriptional activator [Deinococcus ruber]|uniref:Transcriptional activator n=1 Tax=Deinococcus ruber TaxID=1848197 RepID=A0A918EZ61_9DEIO|nr:transcriptional activator [Deinococcus ruber]